MDWGVRERAIAVGQDIAGPQRRQHVGVARRRLVDVAHDRQPGLLRRFDRVVQRHDAVGAAGVEADAHLDAADHVRVVPRDAHAGCRVHQPQVLAFPDHDGRGERKDASVGNVEVGQDARGAALDDVLAKAGEIAWPGGADIHPGRRARPPCQGIGVDAERGAAPIDMRMEVDHPGHDDPPRRIPLHPATFNR